MDFLFEIIKSVSWRLHTFGIAAALGFACIINRIRRQPDAQLPHRQTAGWIMICAALALTLILLIDTFRTSGFTGGIASLIVAVFVAFILVILAGRE
jgi:drug/metabolite transporter (DMT)-like permease